MTRSSPVRRRSRSASAVGIGQDCYIVDGSHNYRDRPDMPFLEQGYKLRPITIEDDAQIDSEGDGDQRHRQAGDHRRQLASMTKPIPPSPSPAASRLGFSTTSARPGGARGVAEARRLGGTRRRLMKATDLAVVIPTRGALADPAAHARRAAPQTVKGSRSSSSSTATTRLPPDLGATCHRREAARRARGGRNRRRRATDRPLVLFLGDDMIPTPGLVAAPPRRPRPSPPTARRGVLGHVDWHPEVADDRAAALDRLVGHAVRLRGLERRSRPGRVRPASTRATCR